MKFFVDANLPYRLALRLRQLGFDAIHTDDLPNKERTTDNEIRQISIDQDRVVLIKDSRWRGLLVPRHREIEL